MTLFINLGWAVFGGWGLLLIALAYAVAGLKLLAIFDSRGYAIPAGICAVFVVCLAPLAVYGLQQAMGWWPAEDGLSTGLRWYSLSMELSALALAVLLLWRRSYPFLMMPVAVLLWLIVIDIAEVTIAPALGDRWQAIVSMCSGLALLLMALALECRVPRVADYPFWFYLVGVLAFWGGLTALQLDGEGASVVYLLVNILLLLTGVILLRRVFVVAAAIGCTLYLGDLSATLFKDSWLFAVSLSFIGLLVIGLEILWQKNERRCSEKIRTVTSQ